MESSSFLGSSKRAKAPANIAQVAHCLVDGCDADLSLCRDYHRRHKVCEAHSKTPKVTIGGREQRFCQQCSRFHSLVEFDEGKRSCRKRLDGHNRRRRKPQATECMSSRSSGLVLSSQHQVHGGRLVSFSSSPQIVPSAVLTSAWGAEEIMQLYNPQQQQLNYIDSQNSPFPHDCPTPQSYKLLNQLHLLQTTSAAAAAAAATATATAMQDQSNHKMFSITNDDSSSDHRALSLLSPPPPPPPTTHHPLHYYPPCLAHQTKPPPTPDSRAAPDSSALHIFQDGSSSHHQTLTFTWE